MTDLEMVEMAGYLFAAWATGYGMGLLITTFRKFADKI